MANNDIFHLHVCEVEHSYGNHEPIVPYSYVYPDSYVSKEQHGERESISLNLHEYYITFCVLGSGRLSQAEARSDRSICERYVNCSNHSL